ncbi:MAG: ATP-binding cassette domain-containing protein [Nitrospirales bacterium]|nr:ATP-binding cassette domain-containing protein [Nitrospirales bacterium]
MIQINGLSKSYGQQPLFQDVTFTINPGERIGLVGRNGHGKTTLFRMILNQEHADEGTISIPRGYTIGHLSQHLRFTEPTLIGECILSLPVTEDGRDETYKAEKVLMGLGFSQEDFTRAPSELSGGFQIRLNLAKLLLSEPDLLLLDEPTNYLDITSTRWLGQFLRNWKGEMMIITHDRDFMNSVTTHTMAIHRCRVRKIEGSTQKLYDQILTEEEVYEKTRINDEKKRQETEAFISRFRAQATKAKAVQSKIKSLDKRERMERLTEIKDLDFQFNPAPFTGKVLLEAKDLGFSYQPEDPLIRDLSLTVGGNDRIAIIGQNGRGKTTLLNLLAKEITPSKGTVEHHPSLRLAYFGQTNIQRLDLQRTVEEEIMEAHPDHSRRVARNICGLMMFEGDSALKKISVLSGGERSRVLLGKLLVSPANLLLLDEPTNHLDMESIDSLIEAISVFEGSVILVTHSEMLLHALATRLVVFDNGEVTVFDGTYQDFLDRVGWKGEAENGEKQKAATTKTPAKKDLRKLRAELIQEKSRATAPLQKGIQQAEERIMLLEEKVGKETELLLAASEKGDWQASSDLSQSIKDAEAEINELFQTLEELTVTLQEKETDFEKRLAEVSCLT